MSGAAIFIKDDLHISDVQVEVLVGILNLYSILGSAAAGRTSDWIGRRYTIVIAGAIFFAGALLMGFATNYSFLMFGRFVAGIGVGYAAMIAPVYIAEVSPASSRGFLTSFHEIFINGGILLGYVSNYAFSKLPTHLGWRMMLGVGAIPSVMLAVGVLAIPESPRWLVMQGRLGEARQVLEKISDTHEEAHLRLADIKQAAAIPEHCNDDIVQQAESRRRSLEGAISPPYTGRPTHPDRGRRNPLLPADYRNRRRRPIQPPDLRKGWDHLEGQKATRDGGGRIREDDLHPSGYVLARPDRTTAVASEQRGGHDPVPGDIGSGADGHRPLSREDDVGGRAGGSNGAVVRGVFLDRDGADHVCVQHGDIPVEDAGPGVEYGGGGQQGDERRHIDDFHIVVQGNHDRWGFPSVCRARHCCLGVFLYDATGDAG
ncbi:hypothetical protein TIFTF001_040839 [Ficus carica]|uniref:Major facilitator superfamily (MFS) profile domain-containing protein n=1 Tax=Ficus carica TaxID=3494 RepID=A0AA87Z6F6_FICCA|nr:hypothetical protein TIFTF001_040839 [Ficus carica]